MFFSHGCYYTKYIFRIKKNYFIHVRLSRTYLWPVRVNVNMRFYRSSASVEEGNYFRPYLSRIHVRNVYILRWNRGGSRALRIPSSSRNVGGGGNCFTNCFMGPVSLFLSRPRQRMYETVIICA